MAKSRKKAKMLRGDRLHQMRQKRGLSQTQLADLVGITSRQISRYETEPVDVSASTLIRLAQVLQCSTDFLLGMVDAPTAIVAEVDAATLDMARRFAALPKAYQEAIKTFLSGEAIKSKGK